VEEQKKTVEEQKLIVEQKNKDITDSLNTPNAYRMPYFHNRRSGKNICPTVSFYISRRIL
jgi:hypothetical protein